MTEFHEHHEEWQKQLVKCIRCGTCRSVCPVFKEENNENTTARGKVKLLESVVEGKLELTPILQERFSKCLLCKACVSGCPSGVKTDELFLSARQAVVSKNGLSIAKRLAFTGLTYRKLFDFGLRIGARFQNLVLKEAPDGRGRIPRVLLPGAGLNNRRIIPSLAKRTLRSQLPIVSHVDKPRARVAFFTGCMLNYIYPKAGQAIVNILQRNKIEVVIPENQCCCGTPAFTSGDQDTGRYLAGQNIKALSGEFDAIITGCASCGSALQHEYGQILTDPWMKDEWQKIASKVYDITTYLVKFCDLKGLGPVNMKVTYHDACHLVRGMGVSKEPRQIFAAIPGLEFREMQESDKCCGGAGSFSMAYYELARKINDHKLDHAEATGADCLVTGCSACRMHITDGLSQRNSNLKIMHTAELIELSYKAGQKEEN